MHLHILEILSWKWFMRICGVVKQQAASTTRQKSETMKNYSKGAVNLDVFNIEWKKKIIQEKLCIDSYIREVSFGTQATMQAKTLKENCFNRSLSSLSNVPVVFLTCYCAVQEKKSSSDIFLLFFFRKGNNFFS